MTKRQKIRTALLEYFERNGEHEFFGSHLTSFVINVTGERYMYPATVLRYLRGLKQEGYINFICLNREKSHYKIIK